MRILVLGPYPGIRGPLPKIVPTIISGLRSLGADVVTERWARHTDNEPLGDKIIGRLRDIVRIRRTLNQGFDLMLVETAHDWRTLARDIPLLLVSRRAGPRIVLHFHGSFSDRLVSPGYWLFKTASAWLLRLSDAAMLLSSEEQSEWEQFYPAGEFHLVANPYLPIDGLSHSGTELKWDLPDDRPVLLFVGKLVQAKGIFDLLNAMPVILGRISCHLLVAGAGANAEQVKENLAELGLTDNVTLTGYIQGMDLVEAYSTASIFVLPTYWAEGFPTVIAEAMDAGLPIVTTRIRGAADHLEDGVNALFVQPRDPMALANTVLQLLSGPSLCARMSHANKEKVKEFAPEKVAREYLSIFEKTI